MKSRADAAVTGSTVPPASEWRPPDPASYAYLLGLYLGDGNLAVFPRTVRLDLSLDAVYPEILEDATAAVQLTALPARVRRRRVSGTRCVRINCHWRGWPSAFPQHGPGRKHERAAAPSTGSPRDCRGRVAEYAYPRYFFSSFARRR